LAFRGFAWTWWGFIHHRLSGVVLLFAESPKI